jgi:hypothetical protein
VATLLSIAQVAGGFYRPGNNPNAAGQRTVWRRAWEVGHKRTFAVACVGLAVAATFTGVSEAAEKGWLGSHEEGVYTAVGRCTLESS